MVIKTLERVSKNYYYIIRGVLIYMVIAGTINRVVFYCRVNHRDRDYEKYLNDVMRRL